VERPNLEFILKQGSGEPLVIKMTYGLFNEIMNVIPNPEDIGSLLIRDPGLRDYVIRRMITGNKRIVAETDLIDPFEMDVDIADLDDLVIWVGDHVLYFFMNSATKVAKMGERYEETIRQLALSKNGAEASPSQTPSAGASTAAKET
jgi:hypothetical protein